MSLKKFSNIINPEKVNTNFTCSESIIRFTQLILFLTKLNNESVGRESELMIVILFNNTGTLNFIRLNSGITNKM